MFLIGYRGNTHTQRTESTRQERGAPYKPGETL